MKQLLYANWHFMRVFRLLLGMVILVQGMMANDPVSAAMGGLLSLLAVMNTGCCGTYGCQTVPSVKDQGSDKNDIEYEEVSV